jgi:epoxyqueuosine reductase QueG
MSIAEIQQTAIACGADLVGVSDAQSLVDEATGRDPRKILPNAQSVVVLAVKYLEGSLSAPQMRIAVNDCRHIDSQLGQISRKIGCLLEDKGFRSVLIPSYFPMEMTEETKGLVGDVSLKQAGACAGLGDIGFHGLLTTPEYGPRIRLAGVLTEMPAVSGGPRENKLLEFCKECGLCIEKCPAQAISQEGVDVGRCVKHVGRPHGMASLIKFIISALDRPKEEVKAMIRSPEFWNYYQNFMIGVHFSCHTCQSVCPVGRTQRQGDDIVAGK